MRPPLRRHPRLECNGQAGWDMFIEATYYSYRKLVIGSDNAARIDW